ncbi:MAG: hypothetical protein AB7H97_15850 [Pseudobdellovibrionaceae bacterium]
MSQFLKIFPEVHWTLIGFFIFFSLFLCFIANTFTKTQRKIYEHLEKLPLEKDSTL